MAANARMPPRERRPPLSLTTSPADLVAEAVQADPDGEDRRVDERVQRVDALVVVDDDRLDRKDHRPDGEVTKQRGPRHWSEVAERSCDQECGQEFHAAHSRRVGLSRRRPAGRTWPTSGEVLSPEGGAREAASRCRRVRSRAARRAPPRARA